MNRRTLIGLALSAALVSTVAVAQQATPSAPPRAKIDANNDGVVDRAEAAKFPRLAGKFDQLDRNRDGRLDAQERPMAGKGLHRGGMRGKGMMAGIDANKDGRISRAEAASRPGLAQNFDRMDVNRDGFLDKADREAHRAQRQAECFAKADTDRNGQLSRAEFGNLHTVCRPAMGEGMRGMHRGMRGAPRPGLPPPRD